MQYEQYNKKHNVHFSRSAIMDMDLVTEKSQ